MKAAVLTILLLLTFSVNAEIYKCGSDPITLQNFPCGEEPPAIKSDNEAVRVLAKMYKCGSNPVTLQNFPCDQESPNIEE